MQGIIFTEFLDLIKHKFGLEMVDIIMAESNLTSKGTYNTTDTCGFEEILKLLENLSRKTHIIKDDLFLVFGEYFFSILENNYPSFFKVYKSPIEMLASIESHLHFEIQKIYPKADLPSLSIESKTKNDLVLIFKSSRTLHHFYLGLMNKTFSYFKTVAKIKYQKINNDGTQIRFIINQIS